MRFGDEVRCEVADGWRETLETERLLGLEAVDDRTDLETVKSAVPGKRVDRLAVDRGRVLYLKRWERPVPPRVAHTAATAEWAALFRLRELGLPAAEAVALVTTKEAALLITAEIPAERTLEQEVLEERLSGRRLRDVARSLARQVRAMHDGGLNHRDLYLGHVLLDDGDRPWFMDLDRARMARKIPRRWRVKDLAALQVSTPTRLVGKHERLRFFASYARGWSRGKKRFLARAAARKAESMRAHIRRRIDAGAPNFHLNE